MVMITVKMQSSPDMTCACRIYLDTCRLYYTVTMNKVTQDLTEWFGTIIEPSIKGSSQISYSYYASTESLTIIS